MLLQSRHAHGAASRDNTQADLADLPGSSLPELRNRRRPAARLRASSSASLRMGKIKATRKYENPIEFAETRKLWIDTNRKPTIRDVDDKATFRLHPIPFTVTDSQGADRQGASR